LINAWWQFGLSNITGSQSIGMAAKIPAHDREARGIRCFLAIPRKVDVVIMGLDFVTCFYPARGCLSSPVFLFFCCLIT
jgi:hypothetical protein